MAYAPIKKAKKKEYLKRYFQENKEDYRKRDQTPERRAYQKEYHRGEKFRAYQKEWAKKKQAERKAQKEAQKDAESKSKPKRSRRKSAERAQKDAPGEDS